jgi:hypothetical protein
MSKSHALLKAFRNLHLYIGTFISPALLFFAFTGVLQTYNLHEASHDGGSYKPPAWAVKLGQLHKKQTLEMPVRRPQGGAGAEKPRGDRQDGADAGNSGHDRHPNHDGPQAHDGDQAVRTAPAPAVQTPAAPPAPQKRHGPMKLFFLLVGIGLFTSTVTGIYMSYKYVRNSKIVVTGLLIAGVVVPLLLLPF